MRCDLKAAALVVVLGCAPGVADLAVLVGQSTIVDNIPIGSIGGEDQFGSPGYPVNRGDGINSGFIDAATLVYDFGAVQGVTVATLTINMDIIWRDAGMDPTIELFSYADDGTIQLTDIQLGTSPVYDSFQYSRTGVRDIDVTDAVNAALGSSRYVGFRFENSRSPFELPNALEGGHYANDPPLEYTAGNPCRPDCNEDGELNTQDFLCFLNLFSSGDPGADYNEDGVVNTLDFLAYLNDFNAGCE